MIDGPSISGEADVLSAVLIPLLLLAWWLRHSQHRRTCPHDDTALPPYCRSRTAFGWPLKYVARRVQSDGSTSPVG